MLKREQNPKTFVRRLLFLAIAGTIAENTCIWLYGFYQYSPRWSLFIGELPLMVALIWPVVIHSAWTLAKRLTSEAKVAYIAAGIVLADASLIEPISVQSGLWSWNEPGLFFVPPVGILGWAFFAFWCVSWFSWCERAAGPRPIPWWLEGAVVLLAPLLTHVLLLASWWGVLRWVNTEIPPWPLVWIAWIFFLGGAFLARLSGVYRRVPRIELWVRVPGALFFFALLALNGRQEIALVAYSLSFAPPYLSLFRSKTEER
jgi:hypothetical protein